MSTFETRQTKTSSNPEERAHREADTRKLADTLIGRHAEFFAEPGNRLEFIRTHDADDMLAMVKHVNARLRGEKPVQLRKDENERGGYLPALHTPSAEDKPKSFARGFEAVQEYLTDSDDTVEDKLQASAMAMEALIIWVHPSNDGNGRTARFFGNLIEDGATDIDELVNQTVSAKERPMTYPYKLASKEGALENAGNPDIMFDDEEREALRERALSLPDDIEAMYLSVKRLLADGSIRQQIVANAEDHRERVRERQRNLAKT